MSSTKNLFRSAAKYYDVDPRGVHSDDIPFYIEFTKEIGAKKILELGCGTGRVSIPLAEAGFLVNGIDLSKEMIEVFSSKLKNMDCNIQNNITLIHTDMSDFSLNTHFDLIIIPFRAFQALTSEKQQVGCLKCAHDHLMENGRFIFDIFLPYDQLDESWIADENVNFETTLHDSGIQIKKLLTDNKFTICEEYGYYDKRQIGQGSEQIFVCKK